MPEAAAARQTPGNAGFSKGKRRVLRIAALALASAMLVALVPAQAAQAAPNATVKARTQRMADANLSSGQNGWYERGAVLSLDCYKRGQAVKGYFSPSLPNGGWDDLWYRVSDGYFVADVDIETGSNNPVTGVCPVPFDAAPAPTIAGDPVVGATLSAQTGRWSPAASFSYQWNLDGQAVGGANGTDFALGADSLGHTVTVTVTGSSADRIPATVTSAPTGAVAAGTLAAPTPTVSGTPAIGQKLTVSTEGWGPQPVDLTVRWLRDGKAIAKATALQYTVAAADAGAKITAEVTGAKAGYTARTATSAPVTIGRPLTAVPRPTIAGTGRVGSTLTAKTGTWTPAPVTLAFQWFRGQAAIPGATKATYVLTASDAGTSVTVRVTGSKSGYTSQTATSAAMPTEGILNPTPVPTLSGTPTVGSTLTLKTGTWGPGTVTLAYQWLRNGKAIPGATAKQYTPVATDAGSAITARVIGSRAGFTTATTVSAPVTVGKALTATPKPKVTGTARVGSTLTAVPGTWAPAPVTLTYQWYRGSTAITGASSASYRVQVADAGASLTVRVTGGKAGYTSVAATSTAVTVEKILSPAPVPTVTGTPTVGRTLTVAAGTWGPSGVALAYQWLRDGAVIAGATKSGYTVVAVDAGHKVSVRVTGSKAGYTTAVRTSAAVVPGKAFIASPTPTIAGTATVGSTLTAKTGTWNPLPTFSYRWYRNGSVIAGATASRYVVTAADATTAITVKVSGAKAGYTTASKTSARVLVQPTTLESATPTVVGNASARSVLTADPGTWGPAPVDFAYQWFVGGNAVGGATGQTFTVPTWAANASVWVTVTGSKAGYDSASQTSPAIGISGSLGDRLYRTESMPVNARITSANGQYFFVLQSDGNLVIYGPAGALWGSRSDGNSVNPLGFQDDGNVVLYRTDGRAVWATATDGKPARELVMQDDGNLVLWGDGGSFWASNTSQGGGGARFKLPFPKGASYRINQGPAEHAAGAFPDYNRHAVDFGMPANSTVVASAGGTVYFEGWHGDSGIEVKIDHGDNLCSQYVHLNASIVNKGQQIAQGQVIGKSGSTGNSTAPHLHWNLVYCNTGKSREVPNTVENGINYPVGTWPVSQNG